MIRPVALQQPQLKISLRTHRAKVAFVARDVRRRTDPFSGSSRNYPPLSAKPLPGRLRLVGEVLNEGDDPAHKVWRLKNMGTTDFALNVPGLAGFLRLVYATRSLLALLGLAVLLVLALPAPREVLLRQLAAWTEALEEQRETVVATVAAGTIQIGLGSAAVREQRAVSEFIAKRYRVAPDATAGFVATAYRAGFEWKVDPLLILAVMAVESRYNPVAESNMGAKGLMQVIPKFHPEKLAEHGGESALLDPHVNIQVGAQILREYMRRVGETETALQMYAGAIDEPTSGYAFKVLAERSRLEQILKQSRRGASA